jgi:hypothetical protein
MAVKKKVMFSAFLRHGVWWLDTNILEDCPDSIFRVEVIPEDGGSMVDP